MDLTEFGMEKEVRDEQPKKALNPMEVTESGMEKEVRDVQPSKA